jgi:hypothetical protein
MNMLRCIMMSKFIGVQTHALVGWGRVGGVGCNPKLIMVNLQSSPIR